MRNSPSRIEYTLQKTMDTIPTRDMKIFMGDWNAKVSKAYRKSNSLGVCGLGNQNERGEDLIEFCNANNLAVTNTLFEHHPRHLYTWISPGKKTRNQTDYITMSQKWTSYIKNVRTRTGADCNSDHQLLTIEIKLILKKMDHPTPPMRLDYKTLGSKYRTAVSNRFEILLQCEEENTPNEMWKAGKDTILKTAKETVDKKRIKNTS